MKQQSKKMNIMGIKKVINVFSVMDQIDNYINENNIKSEHLLTSDQKIKYWGYGEWVEEPDLVSFEYKGIQCKVVRIFSHSSYKDNREKHIYGGHLCGYIRVPESHCFYGKNYNEIEIDVHGALTYSEIDNDNHHYLPKQGHWIGFDCAHSMDIIPSSKSLNLHYCPIFKRTYKNIIFCIEECKSMVDKLCAPNVK